MIQLGAILAVCWAYRERVGSLLHGLGRTESANRFFIMLMLGFLPAAVLGFLFHKLIKAYLFNPLTVAVALIVGGLLILWIERLHTQVRTQTVDDMRGRQALAIGFAQALAMCPGVSRSGATIMGGILLGLSRQAAAEFSFFLAIPTMFAATAYDLYKNHALLSLSDWPLFAVGFIAAFFSGLVAVRGLVRFVSRHTFNIFAWYRIAFGLLVLTSWKFGWVDWSPS